MAAVESVTQTTFSWYPKKYRAELAIDVSDLKRLIGTQTITIPDELIFNRQFGGSDDKEWSVTVKIVTGPCVQVVFTRRISGKTAVTFGSMSNPGPDNRLVVEEGKCQIYFASSGIAPVHQCKTGVIGYGETVCEVVPFRIPDGDCKIKFSIAYSKAVVEEELETKPQRTAESSSKFRDAFKNLFMSGKEADFEFHFNDGEVVRAHKAVLVALAPFFEKMMTSGMTESQTNSVKIEDADTDSFRCVLLFVYCGELPENFDAIATKVLPLAEKYLLEDLKQACVYSIDKSLSPENVCNSLIIADHYNCPVLKKKCIRRLMSWKSNLNSGMLLALQAHPELLSEVLLFSS